MTDEVVRDLVTSPWTPSTDLRHKDFEDITPKLSDETSIASNATTAFIPLFIPCNNPRNILSPFVAEMVDLAVYVGIFPALVTSGVITNVINMAVFARQGLSDRIHVCLFSLAVSDTGFLLFLMTGKSYRILSLVEPQWGNFWLMKHNGTILGNYLAFLSISNLITTIISIERCRCVLNPLKAGKSLRTKFMGVLILVVAIFILAAENVCLTLKYQTVKITHPLTTNSTTYISRLSPLYLSHRTLIDLFDIYIISATTPFVSLIIVTICTSAIIVRLRVTASWRRHNMATMTSLKRKEVTTTRMLVTVCCVYVTCTIPSVSRALLLFSRLPGFLITGHLCNVFKVSTACTLLLEAGNASVNFWIYVKQSSQYRRTLRQLMHCVGILKRSSGKKDDLTI